MTTEIQVSSKEPSQALRMIITNCASNLVEFASTWEEVKVHGLNEGFTEEQLQSMVVTEIRKQLKEKGYKGYQVDNRIYNYLHAKERSIHNKELYQKSLLKKGVVHDNDRQHSSILSHSDSDLDWDKDSALEEITRLRAELNEAHETIKNISFSDNPELVTVRRDSENFFAKVTAREVGSIIAGVVDDLGRKINFWFEEIEQ